LLKSRCLVAVAGFEVADTGTKHLQGYVEFPVKKRPNEFFGDFQRKIKPGHIHWGDEHGKPANGTLVENINYCLKDGKPFIIYGCRPPPQKVNLNDVRNGADGKEHPHWPQMKQIIDKVSLPEDAKRGRDIFWNWEQHGSWGKSLLISYLIDQMGAVILSGKAHDMKAAMAKYVETNGNGPPIVIVNFPKSTDMKYVSWTGLEQVKDGTFFSGKYESGMVRYDRPHMICFANMPPDCSVASADRWKITELEHLR
jgi:hypothetical protein